MYKGFNFFNQHSQQQKMFVVKIKYGDTPLDEINLHLEQHNKFLEENYTNGNFLLSGPQRPRVGGVIIAKAESRNALDAIIERDPFKQLNLVIYKIIEFEPRMMTPALIQSDEINTQKIQRVNVI